MFQEAPSNVIMLQYYTARIVDVGGVRELELQPACKEINIKKGFHFSCEYDVDLDEWFHLISKKVFTRSLSLHWDLVGAGVLSRA